MKAWILCVALLGAALATVRAQCQDSDKAKEIISVLSTFPDRPAGEPIDVQDYLSVPCDDYAASVPETVADATEWCSLFFSNWGISASATQISTCAGAIASSSGRAAYACAFYASVAPSLGVTAPACQVSLCGNGQLDAGEMCDAGIQANGNCTSRCSATCQAMGPCVDCTVADVSLACGQSVDLTALFRPVLGSDCLVNRPEYVETGEALLLTTDLQGALLLSLRPKYACQDAVGLVSSYAFGLRTSPCPAHRTCAATGRVQVVPVVDQEPPTLDAHGLPLQLVACTSDADTITALDACDPQPRVSRLDELEPCGGHRTWTATDVCGNTATLTQVLTAPQALCGNGVVDQGEECDLGAFQNNDCRSGCNATCHRAPICVDCDIGDIVLGCGESVDVTALYASRTELGEACAPRTVEQVGVGSSLEALIDPVTQHVLVRMPRQRRTSFRCDEDDAPAPISTYRFGAKASACPERLVCRPPRFVEGDALAYPAVDRTAPTLVALLEPSLSETVCQRTAPSAPLADDACAVPQTVASLALSGNATCGISEVRSWQISDACGNAMTVSQTVTVTQPEAPQWHPNVTTPVICLWPPNNKIFALSGVSEALQTLIAPWATCLSETLAPRAILPNGPCSVLSCKKNATCRKDWDNEDDARLGTTCMVSNGTVFVVAAKGNPGKARVYVVRVQLVSPCGVAVNATLHVTVPKCDSEACRRESCANSTLLVIDAVRVAAFSSSSSSSTKKKKLSREEALEQWMLDMSALDADESTGFASLVELATLDPPPAEEGGGMSRASIALLLKRNIHPATTLSGPDIVIVVLICVFVGVPVAWLLAVYVFGIRALAFWRTRRH